MTKKNTFEATPEQITEWKRKHGSVFVIEVDGRRAYVKAPDRKGLSYAATVSKGTDAMEFNSAILNSCWLEGDAEIKTDDRLFLGVAEKLDQIIETAEAEIKKL